MLKWPRRGGTPDPAPAPDEPALAKRRLGEAIDACIAAGDLEGAQAHCRSLLEVDPAVVRVHCTLAFLAIARLDDDAAERSIADYVRAAGDAGAHGLAIPSLQLMARASASPRVRGCLADALDALGDADAAALMRRRAGAGAPLQRLIDEGGLERWRVLLQSATLAAIRGAGR